MQTPYVTVHLDKIGSNTRRMVMKCAAEKVYVSGVSKVVCGSPEVVWAMLNNGVKSIADTRIDNAVRIRQAGIDAPMMLIRSPAPSEVEAVVQYFDVSLNTELEVIRQLSEAALRQQKTHGVIVMVDMGDRREGILPEEAPALMQAIMDLQGIRIEGMGMNLLDLNGVIPTRENSQRFLDCVQACEHTCGMTFPIRTAGNSGSIRLLESGTMPAGINHFRLGESIMLGLDALERRPIEGLFQDTFTLYAEVIEAKVKPSLPEGRRAPNAFGQMDPVEDMGTTPRLILNIGRQDVDPDGLEVMDERLKIVGASSDHLVLTLNDVQAYPPGSLVAFRMNYSALLRVMTSPYVRKVYQE